MDNRLARTAATFDRVLALPKLWGKQLKEAGVEGLLDDLRAIVAECKALQQPLLLKRGPTHRGAQIKAWSNIVREHLLTLKAAAKRHLTDASGEPMRLTVPPFKSVAGPRLAAAKEFDAQLRPHAETLIARKAVPPDFLEQLADSANQLEKWRTTAPDERKEHKALRKQLEQQVSKGRATIALLRRRLAATLREDAVFKDAFETAARVNKKPGPDKSPYKTKRQRVPFRKRPKQKLNRPERID